jgi:hypothetical protein
MLKCVSDDAPSLRTLAPWVSDELAAVVARALQRDRELRWPDADTFARALALAPVDDHAPPSLPSPRDTRSMG